VDVIPQTSMRRRTRHGIIRCFRSWRRVTSRMQKGEWDMRSIRDLIAEGAGHYDQSDAEGMTASYADDAVVTAPPGSRAEGKQAILDYWAEMVRAFSDKRGEVGTSIPATGKPREVRGVEFARVRDGKIVEHNMYWDGLDMMRQLGLLPS
jgi:ketosteroid isomerase-like protein